MDELIEQVGDDESHPLAESKDVLKFLMEQHGLKQSDLRKEIGTQGVVSEILSGERNINVRQAKSLAKRFGVSPVVFL